VDQQRHRESERQLEHHAEEHETNVTCNMSRKSALSSDAYVSVVICDGSPATRLASVNDSRTISMIG
jgi:hypothetical protein